MGQRVAVVGAIPARYGSTRLPGKALLPLAGRPMIEHVYRRVARSAEALDRVVVLTDDERIAEAVEGFGGDCEMTPAGVRQRHRPHRLGGAAVERGGGDQRPGRRAADRSRRAGRRGRGTWSSIRRIRS